MKIVKDKEITNIEGKAWKTVETDADGEVVFEDKDSRIPKRRQATAADLIRIVAFSIPPHVQKKLDPLRILQVSNRLQAAKNGTIELKEKQYAWLHRLLERMVPPSDEAKKLGVKDERPLAMAVWGSINYLWFVEQLKTDDEAKTIAQLIEEQDKKDADSEADEDE